MRGLDEQGMAFVPAYWPRSDVERLRGDLAAVERTLEADGSGDLNKKSGALRITRVEKHNPEIRSRYVEDPFIAEVSELFYGRRTAPKYAMYAKTWYDDSVEKLGRDVSAVGFGRIGFHLDTWQHQLKTMLLLSDVTSANGPLLYLPGSHRLAGDKWARVWQAVRYGRGDHGIELYFSDDEERRLSLNERSQPVVGEAGTLVFVNTRGFHKASLLQSGERHILWNYFT